MNTLKKILRNKKKSIAILTAIVVSSCVGIMCGFRANASNKVGIYEAALDSLLTDRTYVVNTLTALHDENPHITENPYGIYNCEGNEFMYQSVYENCTSLKYPLYTLSIAAVGACDSGIGYVKSISEDLLTITYDNSLFSYNAMKQYFSSLFSEEDGLNEIAELYEEYFIETIESPYKLSIKELSSNSYGDKYKSYIETIEKADNNEISYEELMEELSADDSSEVETVRSIVEGYNLKCQKDCQDMADVITNVVSNYDSKKYENYFNDIFSTTGESSFGSSTKAEGENISYLQQNQTLADTKDEYYDSLIKNAAEVYSQWSAENQNDEEAEEYYTEFTNKELDEYLSSLATFKEDMIYGYENFGILKDGYNTINKNYSAIAKIMNMDYYKSPVDSFAATVFTKTYSGGDLFGAAKNIVWSGYKATASDWKKLNAAANQQKIINDYLVRSAKFNKDDKAYYETAYGYKNTINKLLEEQSDEFYESYTGMDILCNNLIQQTSSLGVDVAVKGSSKYLLDYAATKLSYATINNGTAFIAGSSVLAAYYVAKAVTSITGIKKSAETVGDLKYLFRLEEYAVTTYHNDLAEYNKVKNGGSYSDRESAAKAVIEDLHVLKLMKLNMLDIAYSLNEFMNTETFQSAFASKAAKKETLEKLKNRYTGQKDMLVDMSLMPINGNQFVINKGDTITIKKDAFGLVAEKNVDGKKKYMPEFQLYIFDGLYVNGGTLNIETDIETSILTVSSGTVNVKGNDHNITATIGGILNNGTIKLENATINSSETVTSGGISLDSSSFWNNSGNVNQVSGEIINSGIVHIDGDVECSNITLNSVDALFDVKGSITGGGLISQNGSISIGKDLSLSNVTLSSEHATLSVEKDMNCNDRTVSVGKGKISVAGDYNCVNGILDMQDADGLVQIYGDFNWSGKSFLRTSNALFEERLYWYWTAGTIELYGDMNIGAAQTTYGTPNSLKMTPEFTIKLNGNQRQTINNDYGYQKASYYEDSHSRGFGTLIINNADVALKNGIMASTLGSEIDNINITPIGNWSFGVDNWDFNNITVLGIDEDIITPHTGYGKFISKNTSNNEKYDISYRRYNGETYSLSYIVDGSVKDKHSHTNNGFISGSMIIPYEKTFASGVEIFGWYTIRIQKTSRTYEYSGELDADTYTVTGNQELYGTAIQHCTGIYKLEESYTFKECGTSYKFEAKPIPSYYIYYDETAWSSSDESIVTIDDSGLAYAVGVGEADITATIDNYSQSCHITVEKCDIDTCSIEVNDNGCMYRSDPILIESITSNSVDYVLKKDIDYTITAPETIPDDANETTIKIEGIGKYCGEYEHTINLNGHTEPDIYYISGGNGKHYRQCKRCKANIWEEDCSGDDATCMAKSVCKYCKGEISDINPNNHAWVSMRIIEHPTCITEGTAIQDCYWGCGEKQEISLPAGDYHKNIIWDSETNTGVCSDCGETVTDNEPPSYWGDYPFAITDTELYIKLYITEDSGISRCDVSSNGQDCISEIVEHDYDYVILRISELSPDTSYSFDVTYYDYANKSGSCSLQYTTRENNNYPVWSRDISTEGFTVYWGDESTANIINEYALYINDELYSTNSTGEFVVSGQKGGRSYNCRIDAKTLINSTISGSTDITTNKTESTFLYYIDEDDEALISGYIGNNSNISIPSSIDGNTITKIGDYAFGYNESIIGTVEIPSSIKTIGKYAFYNCPNITEIIFDNGVQYIDKAAFSDCNNLEHVVFPDSITYIAPDAFYILNNGHRLIQAEYDMNEGSYAEKWYEEAKEKKGRLSYINESISGNIGIYLYLDLSNVDAEILNSGTVHVEFNDDTNVYNIYDLAQCTINEEAFYIVQCSLAAKDINKKINISVYDSAGNAVKLEKCEYSINDKLVALSLDDIINHSLAESIYGDNYNYLMKCMSAYGNASRVYFGLLDIDNYASHMISTLGDEHFNDIVDKHANVTISDVEPYQPQIKGTADGLKYIGSSLLLDSGTAIRHYFRVEEQHSISDYTFEINGTTVIPSSKDNIYYIEISNISAPLWNEMYTLKVDQLEIQYGVYSYIYKALSTTSSETLNDLVRYMYLYGEAASSIWQ